MKAASPRDARRRSGAWTARLCCLLLLGTSCCAAQSLEKATLALQWQHQAQFAGYYMAQAKGFYEKEGLDVDFRRGGADVSACEMLRSGEADFACLMLSTALQERSQNTPLLHLSQIVNKGNFLLVAWRHLDNGLEIKRLTDLNGQKTCVWERDFRAPYQALFALHGVTPVMLPQYTSFCLFLHRGAAAFSAMRYNEYHALRQSGVAEEDITVFPLRDYGVDMPEDGVYCLEDAWRRRRPFCQAFARASLEGWRYARDHEEETLDAVMERIDQAQLPTNRMHMKWMLREILTSIFPAKEDSWTAGGLSQEAYASALNILSRHAGLENALDYEAFTVGEAAYETP